MQCQYRHFRDDSLPVCVAVSKSCSVMQALPGVPQEQPAVLNLARCKHKLNEEMLRRKAIS